jgi:menaquinone-dependent protoporphyrinogen oxidase
MKVLIIYSTRHGSTKKVAERIAGHFDKADVVEVSSHRKNDPDPKSYDLVIAGAPVYTASVDRKLRDYLRIHADQLERIPLGLFLLCITKNTIEEEYFSAAFPENQRRSALETAVFGGEILLSRLSVFERVSVRNG